MTAMGLHMELSSGRVRKELLKNVLPITGYLNNVSSPPRRRERHPDQRTERRLI